MNARARDEKTVRSIEIDDLHFDPDNPRLPLKLRGESEAQVFAFLLRECSLIELMLSIGSQGFFQGEPLLVVPRTEGGYTVVEGNRRLAAVKLLSREEPPPVFVKQVQAAREAATHKPRTVPVLEFGSRDEILVYLGYRHITGVNEWGALEKARYLQQLAGMYGDQPDKYKALAKQIGSRADYVAKTLAALDLVELANDNGFFDKARVDPDQIPFSLLTTALSYKTIGDFVGVESNEHVDIEKVDVRKLNQLFSWLFVEEAGTTRVGESRNLRTLARVVSNEKALASFVKGASLEEADVLTEGPLFLVRKMLADAERRLSTAQENLKHVNDLTPDDAERATTVEKVARYLRTSIEAEIKSDR